MAVSETLNFENARVLQALYGNDSKNLKLVEDALGVQITTRDGWLKITGPQKGVNQAREVFSQLATAQEKGVRIRKHEFRVALDAAEKNGGPQLSELHGIRIQLSNRKPPVVPRTLQQKAYLEMIQANDLVFGLGPAGTGKTFLAMAMAMQALKSEQVARVILTRPAVEAGEALGFLPGDLREKILPYLRPLYDALYEMMETDEIERMLDKGMIEIAPLAYMRGRTLARSFIILDEGQNTTTEQMFMLLTRLGPGSQCVVTGDPTQSDLPHNRKSGLIESQLALKHTKGIGFCHFTEKDVVRHELVAEIIHAYRAHRGDKNTSTML